MRISDWSSDVCSSDLIGPAWPRISGWMIVEQQESIIAMQQRLLHDCTDWQECLALSTLNRGDERATLPLWSRYMAMSNSVFCSCKSPEKSDARRASSCFGSGGAFRRVLGSVGAFL